MPDRKTILIVDDEEPLRRLMARILERAGHAIRTAGDGDEALQALREGGREIDLVVLDVILPGGGAQTILPAMLEERPDLRVILASGDELPESLRSRLQSVGGAFLRKPFVPRALLRLVDEARAATPTSPVPPSGAPGPL